MYKDTNYQGPYFNFDTAIKYRSKTKAFPFVILHECQKSYFDTREGVSKIKTREYFSFDDVEQFMSLRQDYPHAHEVVFPRINEKTQGRLVFDFDFTEFWYGLKQFVSPSFEKDIETLVIDVFLKYYSGVDVSRFKFVWLVSETKEKWSKHLIVKNAFFAEDWKKQGQCFYNLLMDMVEKSEKFPIPADKIIDHQVIRSKANMRMLGSTKLAKDKKLRFDYESGCFEEANFYDSLIQLQRRQDIEKEQHIYNNQLNLEIFSKLVDESPDKLVKEPFIKKVCEIMKIDLTKPDTDFMDIELNKNMIGIALKSLEIYTENLFNGEETQAFKLKDVMGSLINLERRKPSRCIISNRKHDNENAFLVVTPRGGVFFHCRRGCKHGSTSGLCIKLQN